MTRPMKIAALVLAAGRSVRMGGHNKLLAKLDGVPLVTRVASALVRSHAEPVIVVTGHERDRVKQVLSGQNVTFVNNPDYADGMSTSLRRGLAALTEDVDAALVCLGDMPHITSAHIDRLVMTFHPTADRAICVPTFAGKRGNPVLWAKRFFVEMGQTTGDVGARDLIARYADLVHEVEMGDNSVLIDIDTPADLTRLPTLQSTKNEGCLYD